MTSTQAAIFTLSLTSPFILSAVIPEVRRWKNALLERKGPSLMIILAIATVFFTTQTASGTDVALPGPMRMIRIGILFLLLMWAGSRIIFKTQRLSNAGAASYWLLLYSILAMLSAIWSPISLLTLWKGFEVFVIVLVAISLSDEIQADDGVDWLLRIFSITVLFFVFDLLFSALLASGEAFANFQVSSGSMAFAAHGIAPSLHPNSATQMGAFLTAMTVAGILNSPNKKGRLTLWLLIGLGVAAMILGHSRTSLFSCTLAIMMILMYGGHLRLAIFLGILGALGIAVSSLDALIVEFVLRGQDEEGFTSMSGRVDFWAAAWEAVGNHPWIGYGFYAGQRTLFGSSTVDNTYLEVLLNLGIFGIIIFVLPVIITMKKIYFSRPVKGTGNIEKFLWLQFAAVFIVVFVRSLSGPTFQVLHHSLVFFSLITVATPALAQLRSSILDKQAAPPLGTDMGRKNTSRLLRVRKPVQHD